MAYKVFISHSSRDQGLVLALADLFVEFGLKTSVAEWYLAPGERLGGEVFRQIDEADCVVVLLTRHGTRSRWVHQEIGYALKGEKPLIPVVEDGVEPQDLGALVGRECIFYDPSQPWEALKEISTYVKSLQLRKRDQEKALLVAGGIMAFLLFLAGAKK